MIKSRSIKVLDTFKFFRVAFGQLDQGGLDGGQLFQFGSSLMQKLRDLIQYFHESVLNDDSEGILIPDISGSRTAFAKKI